MVRHKLECGKWAKGEAKVWLIGESAGVTSTKLLETALRRGKALEDKRRKGGYVPTVPQVQVHHEERVGADTALVVIDQPPVVPPQLQEAAKVAQASEDAAAEAEVDKDLCSKCHGDTWLVIAGQPEECPACQGEGTRAAEEFWAKSGLVQGTDGTVPDDGHGMAN
jgi:hypothetical protein